MEACCTCATLLSQIPGHDDASEKPPPPDRRLECCPRTICGKCIQKNPRFSAYCPYCQISLSPTPLPQGLKEPPSYASSIDGSSSKHALALAPPPYSASPPLQETLRCVDEKSVPGNSGGAPADDILHFLDHDYDTVLSLSLRYGVPVPALRRANNLTSDYLLAGRRTILIPSEYYKGGISLSPRPVAGEEEELRKSKIRRFMVACKVSEYDIAVLYLDQSGYDLEAAVEMYLADEAWEARHPRKGQPSR
ncbi:hypothetical protein BX600DRAFT_433284 [Xylariales sp. PMI_506]|nr:hypothetical protein BX600DRAFT_433284 [Xylariales sp. PMI_506]